MDVTLEQKIVIAKYARDSIFLEALATLCEKKAQAWERRALEESQGADPSLELIVQYGARAGVWKSFVNELLEVAKQVPLNE